MKYLKLIIGLVVACNMNPAWSSSTGKLRSTSIPINLESITRGADMVAGICMGCHSLKYISYRDLLNVGIPQDKVDAYRGDRGLDHKLMSFTPAEGLKPVYGMVPPDLSLMAKARKGGGRYVFSLLSGFHSNEKGEVENSVFPGIRMPDILGYAAIKDEKSKTAVDNNLKDAVAFLEWTADPNVLTRFEIGKYVLIYLVILTVLLYLVKRKVWSDIK